MPETLEIRDQSHLGFSKTLHICFSGIYHRLFRSLVTVMVIALAVAFVVNVVQDALFARHIFRSVREDVLQDTLFVRWTTWLSQPVSLERLSELLAGGEHPDRLAELAAWANADGETLASLEALAAREREFQRFIEGLPAGRRRALIGGRSSSEAAAWITLEGGLETFLERLANLKSIHLPGGIENLRDLAARRAEAEPVLEAMRAGHAAAIAGVRGAFPDLDVEHLLTDPPWDLRETLEALGFRVDAALLEGIARAGERSERFERLSRAVRDPGVRGPLAARLNRPFVEITPSSAAPFLQSRDGARWFLEKAREAGVEPGLSAQEVQETASHRLDRLERDRIVRLAGSPDPAFWGLGERAGWLLLVSMLVCTVGIANAMLMSVAERFREIATMKCLGATDGGIMALFVIESCVLGLAGGILGSIAGSFLGVLRGVMAYGGFALARVPVDSFALAAVSSVVYGIVLAGLVAIYPAWVAARLAPMEAMRVE